MYSDVFCRVYNELGWNYYPESFARQLLIWLQRRGLRPGSSMDLGCGTGVLCRILAQEGIRAAGMDLSQGMIAIARQASPELSYEVADMTVFCPDRQYDLVTCTGDALNHIHLLSQVEQVFRNVYRYTADGGYFIFDILNKNEVSTCEPFELDFSDRVRVWFQMTQPEENRVLLKVRVFEEGQLQLEEEIRETVHPPEEICRLLRRAGFTVEYLGDRLLEDSSGGTTWFVVARKDT